MIKRIIMFAALAALVPLSVYGVQMTIDELKQVFNEDKLGVTITGSPIGSPNYWQLSGTTLSPIDSSYTVSGTGISTTTTFLQLTDTPSAYTGQAGLCAAVNAGEDALEFIACSSGGASSASGVFATSSDNLLAYMRDGEDSAPFRMLIGGTATTSNVYFEMNDGASSTDGYIAVGSLGGNVLILDENGRLGLNDSTPSYLLDVNGTFQATGNSLIGGTLGVTGGTTLSSTLVVNGVSTFNAALTGGDITATTTMDIPSGTPGVNAAGEIGVDTTSDDFAYYGAAERRLSYIAPSCLALASTTWAGIGGTGTSTIPLGPATYAETWNSYQCFTDTGTAFVQFGDGTNNMTSSQASTTVGIITTASNNTFTLSEKRYINVGTFASSPNFVSCCVNKMKTAD